MSDLLGSGKTILVDSIHNEGILTNDTSIKRMKCPNSQDGENIADASFREVRNNVDGVEK